MMFKKIAFAAPLAVLALSSSMAFAATEVRHSISLVATITPPEFKAEVVDADLVNKDQNMSPNATTNGELATVVGAFNLLNTAGAVHAKLEYLPTLVQTGGSNVIGINVSVNGKDLTTLSEEVVNVVDSNVPYRAPIVISAKSGSSKAAGNYTGNAVVIFEPSVI
jgi:hypothetical protein